MIYEPLTQKEKDILIAICEKGLIKNKDIAEYFCISINTVYTHLCKIYDKTNIHGIACLIFNYYNGGLNEYI